MTEICREKGSAELEDLLPRPASFHFPYSTSGNSDGQGAVIARSSIVEGRPSAIPQRL